MAEWSGKTRGNLLGYRIFVALIRHLGLRAAYALLRFVSLWFFLFGFTPRKHMVNFYTQAMGYSFPRALILTRRNFYLIGQTLVDRFAFLIGKGSAMSYSMNGNHYLKQMTEAGKGGILVSGHVGNWDIAGNMLKSEFNKPINVVMFDGEQEQIKKYWQDKTGGPAFNIIAIKQDLSHIFMIKQAVDRGEFVCIHADRFLPGSRTITLDFLGKPARFPFGPFHIASKLNAPVTFVFAVKGSDFHYKLSATPPMDGLQKPEVYAQAFVKTFEEKVKATPEQWFNYFDFYKMED
ncbi:MAG: lysophospholipid acyltransferase family protein [Bacteroidetes bacterium]|nr:lysophospholipid acyltransferase family protein [Bacteroidota bacterium]